MVAHYGLVLTIQNKFTFLFSESAYNYSKRTKQKASNNIRIIIIEDNYQKEEWSIVGTNKK